MRGYCAACAVPASGTALFVMALWVTRRTALLLMVWLVAACMPVAETATAQPVGSGTVTFGVGYDPATLEVTTPKNRFTRAVKEIAWRAEFTEPAGSTSLTLILAKVGSGGSEELVYSEDVT